MRTKERQAYIDWIRETRGTMTQEEFGRKICHFVGRKDKKVCGCYHRNEVGNWEKGKNLPLCQEAFLSIAFIDFQRRYPQWGETTKERNRRFWYVQEKMEQLLGQTLYSRNIHDVLLIQVCRGVITFEELLELEPALEELVQTVSVDQKEKRAYALQRETEHIAGMLFRAKTKKDIRDAVESSKVYFYTGNRTFGERLRACYENRARYTENISFSEAVLIFAPNYRDSFKRAFISSGITRQWVIDLCVHLRFNREEISALLKDAHLVPLSEAPEDEEYYCRESDGEEIGSVLWYQRMEEQCRGCFPEHYGRFRSFSLEEKICVLLLFCTFVMEIGVRADFVPADYLLESVLRYDSGRDALKAVKRLQASSQTEEECSAALLREQLRADVRSWLDYLSIPGEWIETDEARAVYQSYLDEFRAYTAFPLSSKPGDEAEKMRYFTALLFTVFTGRYYTGKLREKDLAEIEEQIKGSAVSGWKVIYGFVNQLLYIFLSGQPIFMDEKGRFFCQSAGKKTNKFDLEEIYSDLWECAAMLRCTK